MTLMEAMMQALTAQQPGKAAGPATGQMGALQKAMMGKGGKPSDAKFRSLAALPPYAESKHADKFAAQPSNEQGAFQPDAFQNDAFQVS